MNQFQAFKPCRAPRGRTTLFSHPDISKGTSKYPRSTPQLLRPVQGTPQHRQGQGEQRRGLMQTG